MIRPLSPLGKYSNLLASRLGAVGQWRPDALGFQYAGPWQPRTGRSRLGRLMLFLVEAWMDIMTRCT